MSISSLVRAWSACAVGGAQEQISSSSTLETLHNAALHLPGARGAAGLIHASSSKTWGVDSIDLPVLYGRTCAQMPPAIVASDGWRVILASCGWPWRALV